MAERMIQSGGIELCTEPFGDPTDPPVLLVMGVGASMLWWEEELCRSLADGGRFVIRYDHRDTGRSTTYDPGRPGYDGGDLVLDAAGVVDAYGLGAAHVVGVSAGGGVAQHLALDLPDRVLSLVLISTSPATPGDRDLPPPKADFGRFVADAEVDWSDRESVIEYLVGYARLLAGGKRPFDEAACRDLVRRDVERANNVASLQNHDVMAQGDGPHPPLSSITAPTLVIHGTADPMFPPAHGQALAEEIPGATMLRLDRAGHGVDRADWATIVPAILRHTGPEMLEDLTDAEIEVRLAAAPPERWVALSEARAAFDAEKSHGTWKGGTGDPIQMPWVDYAPAAEGIVTAIYALGASAPFDWSAWGGLNRYPHGEGLAEAPVAECIRMATAIVRADRFSEGTKLAFFDDGTFELIVDRLRRWHDERVASPD